MNAGEHRLLASRSTHGVNCPYEDKVSLVVVNNDLRQIAVSIGRYFTRHSAKLLALWHHEARLGALSALVADLFFSVMLLTCKSCTTTKHGQFEAALGPIEMLQISVLGQFYVVNGSEIISPLSLPRTTIYHS